MVGFLLKLKYCEISHIKKLLFNLLGRFDKTNGMIIIIITKICRLSKERQLTNAD